MPGRMRSAQDRLGFAGKGKSCWARRALTRAERDVDEIRRTFKIVNRLGLHARPASQVVKVASNYRAKLFLEKGGQRARATSILELLLLCGQSGTELTLVATGADAEHVVNAVGQLIGDRFGEAD